MALMDQQNDGLFSQTPQQNQTLTGNPATDPNAQTSWMAPTNISSGSNSNFNNTGVNGGALGNMGSSQSSPSQTASGTMLGQISAGNISQQAPPGFDQGKWNDPNKHDPKYDVGRILSKYPASTQGLQAAMAELGPMGYRMTGKDTIIGPDGIPVDVGFAFGSGEGSHWQWNPNDPNSTSGATQTSMIGANQAQNPNLAAQQLYQQLLARRQMFAQQQFNPSGGQLPFANQGPITPPMFANQPQYNITPQNPQPGMSYLTGMNPYQALIS